MTLWHTQFGLSWGRKTSPSLYCIAVLLIVTLVQTASAQLAIQPDRVDTEWILRYEQIYGYAGLYVDEPPASEGDEPARVRRELITLTKAAREYRERLPDSLPTPETLKATRFLDKAVSPPDDAKYVYSPETGRFLCSLGGKYDIVYGALAQLHAAERYRRKVINGSVEIRQKWKEFSAHEQTPELIKREIETRLFVIGKTDNQRIRDARKTQELLGELAEAMDFATATGMLKSGASITMQDIGATGLIDTLEALPQGGKYQVTTAGEPPTALVHGKTVMYSPTAVREYMKAEAELALRENPAYPPALALMARYQNDTDAMYSLDRAIDIWPDVPALRIQRLALKAKLGRVADLTPDMDDILARFPATPLMLEIDLATRQGPLTDEPTFRSSIAKAMADIRPEVLNLQILAIKELTAAGRIDEALETRARLVERHPGYDAVLPSLEKSTQ